MNFLKKYFSENVEYPNPTKVMMEPGWLLSYIDSQFLSGWINHLEILDAYLITRYQSYQENLEKANTFNQQVENGCVIHQNISLSLFGDDVLILAKEKPLAKNRESYYPQNNYFYKSEMLDNKTDSKCYWVFWFDQDSSDCCIGRFYFEETQEVTLRQEFKDYCFQGPSDDLGGNRDVDPRQREPIYLKLNQTKGWLNG